VITVQGQLTSIIYRTLPSSAFFQFNSNFSSVVILVTGTLLCAGKRLQIKELGMVFLFNHGWDFARLPQAFIKSLQQELPIMVVQCCWLLKLLFGYSYHFVCTIGCMNQEFLFSTCRTRQVILNKI
jgi:hypothetical protein